MSKIVLLLVLSVFAGQAWAKMGKYVPPDDDDGAVAIETVCLDGGCWAKYENNCRPLVDSQLKWEGTIFGTGKAEAETEKGDGKVQKENEKSKHE